ncbi:MAG: RagB/SusD family nutrient uptake outer membrane protein [Bacteroidaceae bacterium]
MINSFEASSSFSTYMTTDTPNEMSELYGEAVALRATVYLELTRFWGDVPLQLKPGVSATGLTSRDYIWEYNLKKLKEVEPVMYRVGENSDATALVMTRTYVQGLIGRYCLYAGGYATRRTDLGNDFYQDLDGNTLSFETLGSESNGAKYCRRTDYKTFYETAETYLKSCVDDPGTVKLVTTDSRSGSNGQEFGNPYQYVFQQMNDLEVSDEDIYEIAESQGQQSERPYAFGRPSNGGSSNAYPCKSYGQSRFQPVYYYGDFDPNDMRRDVTCTVTGSTGGGYETMIPFTPGSKAAGGGIANNKWDENRMADPYVLKSRKSGINDPYMRFSDVILMLAEVYNQLGDDASAKVELAKVHNRAFATEALADVDGFISKCGSMKDAILEERKLEFGGEGIRRYDMIRTGTMPEAIKTLKASLSAMISGLEANGYYTFDNGNTISDYVWTKSVDAKSEYGYRLTTQASDVTDPVLYPSWRGQNDDWESIAQSQVTTVSKQLVYPTNPKTNLAIEGLFEYIDPNGSKAKALEDVGYTRVDWGATIVEYAAEYSTDVFCGYTDGTAPIYLVPMDANTISTSNGAITNGYGFAQE